VLPYLFEDPTSRMEPEVAAFRERIRKRQKVATHPAGDVEGALLRIVQDVNRVAKTLGGIGDGAGSQSYFLTVLDEDEEEELHHGDAAGQERRIETDPRLQLRDAEADGWAERQLAANPARTGAAEQRREAIAALARGEWRLAVWHLERAAEQRPWDLATCFWQARLLLVSGSRGHARRALNAALRGARIAESAAIRMAEANGQEFRDGIALAACYLLAARAAEQMDLTGPAVEYAKLAHQAAGNHFWVTHYELARQYALAGEPKPAMESLQSAFFLRPATIRAPERDPAFLACQNAYRRKLAELNQTVLQEVGSVLNEEVELWTHILDLAENYPGEESRLPGAEPARAASRHATAELQRIRSLTVPILAAPIMIRCARDSFRRQVDALRTVAAQIRAFKDDQPELLTHRDERLAHHAEREAHAQQNVRALRNAWWSGDYAWDGETLAYGLGLTVIVPAIMIAFGQWVGAVITTAMLLLSTLFIAEYRGRRAALEEALEQVQAVTAERDEELEDLGLDMELLEVRTKIATLIFLERVQALEKSAGKRRIYCQTAAIHSASTGDLVRLDRDRHQEQFEMNDALLPEDAVDDQSERTPGEHRIYRITGRAENKRRAERWACYFHGDASET
jgi:hypothetical protein